ncbi:MAG: 23S rRNA (uracil(1939)-C(5))-methyltransferase RlmD [Magnetococcus sp. DMHC-6]
MESLMEEIELDVQKVVNGGAGLAYHDGSTVFVPFTAPGERVLVGIEARRKGHLQARLLKVIKPGIDRVEPRCPVYSQCGGCALSHLSPECQAQLKQEFVANTLYRLGRVEPQGVLQPFFAADNPWGYRRRAGFKVSWAGNRALVGFYSQNSHHVVDLPGCPVLRPELEALIAPLRHLIPALTVRKRLLQVDVASGENGVGVVFHLMDPLRAPDRHRLIEFAKKLGLASLIVQQGSRSSQKVVWRTQELFYSVDGGQLTFRPGEFIQANLEQNNHLVRLAMEEAKTGSVAWDLFAGIGNFSLPLAKRYAHVVGVELDGPSLNRARVNSHTNNRENVKFVPANLINPLEWPKQLIHPPELILMDPPRDGALALSRGLANGEIPRSERLLYISCDPATFARDAGILVQGGYFLSKVTAIDLFPQTHHVELVATFHQVPHHT